MDRLDTSRRAFLRGRLTPPEPPPIRPPWAKAEPEFTTACTRCQACLPACPAGILRLANDGYPQVDFSLGECTFCRACIDACTHGAFLAPDEARPWNHVAAVGAGCLGLQGVYCRNCGDVCQPGAISFGFGSRAIPIPSIDPAACTGCGACIAACPAAAISTVTATSAEDAAT